MSNPLLDKYDELYGKPKEELKECALPKEKPLDDYMIGLTSGWNATNTRIEENITMNDLSVLNSNFITPITGSGSACITAADLRATSYVSSAMSPEIDGFFKKNGCTYLIIEGEDYIIDNLMRNGVRGIVIEASRSK